MADGASRRSLFRETRKPLALLHETINVMGAGRFPEGQTEIPFEAEVKGIDGMVRFFTATYMYRYLVHIYLYESTGCSYYGGSY